MLIDGKEWDVPAESLWRGESVVCRANDVIPADGEVIEGIASVDESAVTGESAPVIRESGGDRSAVTGGTRVICDRIVIQVTAKPGDSFIDRMISLIEGAKRQKTPNEIALSIVLAGLTIVFLLAVTTLKFFADYSAQTAHQDLSGLVTVPVLIALLVCLIPATIGGLLSAVGIAGIDRLIRRNVIARSGRAVEAAQLASLSDETPEGRSIVVLAKDRFDLRAQNLTPHQAQFIPFSAQTRMSGVDICEDGETTLRIRKGEAEAIRRRIEALGGRMPDEVAAAVETIARSGGTPLVVSDGAQVLGVVHLKDVVKRGIRERFADLRRMGIRTVMITGDNALTAAAIAAEAGVDDFLAQATPEAKFQRIRDEQKSGHLVAMTGEGTNDAPALAQADVGVAMNTGTQVAREAGNMVDLDSNPTKLIDVVETGKQMLMTRGELTTFSIANDVAEYFAILPAMFGSLYAVTGSQIGPLAGQNVMRLVSPQSAILSAVIFNALIIIALIPLALRGVRYRAGNAASLLRRNVLVYGGGGLIAPFIGIKLIDLFVTSVGLIR
jgi:potassium-transporting ATPase ATP-binding subunit